MIQPFALDVVLVLPQMYVLVRRLNFTVALLVNMRAVMESSPTVPLFVVGEELVSLLMYVLVR